MNPTPEQTLTAAAEPAQKQTMDISEIMSILPHRYPFLLIDRVVEIKRRERIVALKNVTINEPFFQGHFPGYPIMPGVLMIEAAAQAGGALLLTEYSEQERIEKLMVFTGIEDASFRRGVMPGDQVRIEVNVMNWRTRAVKLQATITVEGKLACEAVIKCQLVSRRRISTVAASEETSE